MDNEQLLKAFRYAQQHRKTEPSERQADLLAQLTPSEAEIIRLVDFDGLDLEDAAKAAQTSPTAAEWLYRKANWHLWNLQDAHLPTC